MIPDHIVEEVRVRADLVEVIGEQVKLQRSGREFKGLCPFHHEKTPSFYVVPAKGFYKCFGCGEAGDAFSFLMKRQGLSFNEAVREIAGKVGVEIPEETTRPQDEPHRALYEAIAFAADFYREKLWDAPEGQRARDYLNTRELTRAMAERFGLGYAPDAWRSLREAAHKHGIEDAVLLEAGLIKEPEKTDNEPYDRLRDRLIFPIGDLSGRWIGFGGRVIGKAAEGVGKYLNSPATPIYHKGRNLYGLNWSRTAIRREKAAILVEGFMDYVSLAARGVDNVVAGLGTAMTDEQAQLLSRYARQAMLLYDSDAAGLKATFKAGDTLLQAGVEPLVVTLPVGEDPDSLVRKGGADALSPHLAKAVDVLDRKLQILKEKRYFESIEGIRKALDRLLPTLRAAADPTLKDIYVSRVAERTGVRRETLERELTNEGPVRNVRMAREPGARAEPPRANARTESWASEQLLLVLLLRDPERIPHAAALLGPEIFRAPVHRELYEAMVAHGPLPEEPPATFGLSVAARQRLTELRGDHLQIVDGDQSFDDAVAGMMQFGLQLALDEVRQRMSLASADEIEALQREEQLIHSKLADLGTKKSKLGYKLSPRMRRHRERTGSRRPGPSAGENG
jgi:DNA primase